jgi:hypothetical protein
MTMILPTWAPVKYFRKEIRFERVADKITMERIRLIWDKRRSLSVARAVTS